MQVLIKIVVNAVAIWVATALLPGIQVSGSSRPRTILTLLLIGAIFGLVNTIVKPIVKILSLPLYVLSLGLFALIVNAVMLELSAWIARRIGVSFTIDHFFWTAVLAAVIVTVVSMILHLVLPDDS